MNLIGLSGYARAGKDTVAQILISEYGYERRAFADVLYEAVRLLNPKVEYFGQQGHPGEFHRLQHLVEWHGWEALKARVPDLRPLLQRMGTEVGRNLFGENVWVDAAFRTMNDNGRYVITDCRFENEASGVLAHGGAVLRVSRPGYGPANDHISEVGLDNWSFDGHITNDGSLDDLATEVDRVLLSLSTETVV